MAKERLVDEIGQFASVPFSFLETKGISPYARCIFLFLRMHTNSKTKTAFPSYETLRAETGMTKRKISNALSELETAGWLVKQRRFADTTEYTLTIPKPALSNTPETAISNTVETALSNTVETNAPYRELDRSTRKSTSHQKKPRPKDPEPPFQSREFLAALEDWRTIYHAEYRHHISNERLIKIYADLKEWGEEKAIEGLRIAARKAYRDVYFPDGRHQNGFGSNGSGNPDRQAEKCDPDRPMWMAGQRKQ